jgi:hypothetical protein
MEGDDERTRCRKSNSTRSMCRRQGSLARLHGRGKKPEKRGEHNMTTKDQITQAEEALRRTLEKVAPQLSEPAHDLLSEARGASYAAWLSPNSPLQLEEYEETEKKLCSAAAKLTDQDRELLAEVARAHKAASDSIDPDEATYLGYVVVRDCYHGYYNMVYSWIEETLGGTLTQ